MLDSPSFVVLAVVPFAALLSCGDRTIAVDGDEGSEETGSSEDQGDSDSDLLTCDGPQASSGPLELVSGEMQPGPFVRVGQRIYWADERPDRWDDDYPSSITLYRTEAAAGEPWNSVAVDQPGINRIDGDDEAIYWTVEGPSPGAGELLRASLDDAVEVLDQGLLRPLALELDDQDGWLYYVEGGELGDEGGKILRIRPDGSSKQLLADSLGEVRDIALTEAQVWWTVPIVDEVWRVDKDGGEPELVAEVSYPAQIEVSSGYGWTLGLSGLHRVSTDEPPYFINGHGGPREMRADPSHVYLVNRNHFEDTELGWISRYPLHDGEYDPLAGEFVTAKASPRPRTVRVDEEAIYWATADEESGQGAIWMLCKSAL